VPEAEKCGSCGGLSGEFLLQAASHATELEAGKTDYSGKPNMEALCQLLFEHVWAKPKVPQIKPKKDWEPCEVGLIS